jgi:uncharacterized protein (DUF58 family)
MSRMLDPRQELALRRLSLAVHRRLEGLLHGDYTGLRLGPGSEPDEARPYQPGQDDVRRMDWNVTARSLEPHVRSPLSERELETWALVDGSASMDFGTVNSEKRDLATAIVAAVGLLADRPGNRLGVRVAYGERLTRIPARTGGAAMRRTLRTLLALPRIAPGQFPATDLAGAITRLHRDHPRPGLRVIASDFLPSSEEVSSTEDSSKRNSSKQDSSKEDSSKQNSSVEDSSKKDFSTEDSSKENSSGKDSSRADSSKEGMPAWQAPLRRLAARHEVIAVEVIDPRELELPDVGLLALVDPETGRRQEVWTRSRRLRQRYAEAAAAHREQTKAAFAAAGVAHLVLRTDRDWVRSVAEFAATRRRTAQRARRREVR